MKKHVYLTGFMGAGKSRIGRTLAGHWSWPYFDTDKIIETEAQKSVFDIFENDGENVFRLHEAKVISKVSEGLYPSIISLGGGALKVDENFSTITKTGILVYIKSAPEYIFERVKHNRKRPLLQVDEEDFEAALMHKIKKLLAEREHLYLKSDIIYKRDGMEPEEILPELTKRIEQIWDKTNEND